MLRSRALGLIASVVLVAPVALAWSQGADFSATVHGHAFKRVEVESNECVLDYRIYFDAPADAYTSPAKPRDVYLFRTRIDFASGKSAPVPVFANRAPGARVYENHFDSTADGCWVKEKQALRGVKVEACRGDGCKPEPIH
jgi:hypothetical protein